MQLVAALLLQLWLNRTGLHWLPCRIVSYRSWQVQRQAQAMPAMQQQAVCCCL
jgi:hypothetical protein